MVVFLFPFSRFGTHAIVCCPGYSSNDISNAIFFPTDPAHPEYGAGAEDYDYHVDIDLQVSEIPIPKVIFEK